MFFLVDAVRFKRSLFFSHSPQQINCVCSLNYMMCCVNLPSVYREYNESFLHPLLSLIQEPPSTIGHRLVSVGTGHPCPHKVSVERHEKALHGTQRSEVRGVNMWCEVIEVRQSLCLPTPHHTHTWYLASATMI